MSTTSLDSDHLKALQRLVTDLERDLLTRVEPDDAPERHRALHDSWQSARDSGRTGQSFTEWREAWLTQIAVAWVLTALFLRYLEDNAFIDPAISGPGARLARATERQRLYFLEPGHGVLSDTDYLLHLFDQLAAQPAGDLFSPARNPLHRLRISGDAATRLLRFFRDTDPDSGDLRRDYTADPADPDPTRFLGDLYQDLSEAARKHFALLQTPDFVEDFILDHTLEPAIRQFGLDTVRFIDPTCGSGHFLLGGFRRLLQHRRQRFPHEEIEVATRRALDATHGVDLNPFAVAIARFRLTLAAFQACGVTRWDKGLKFPLHIATGDSLIHGTHFPRFHTDATAFQAQLNIDRHRWDDQYSTEDNDLIFGTPNQTGILTQQYHAVVGNPPYITPKDPGARDTYREHYAACYRSYALVCPFFERFFELAQGERLSDPDVEIEAGYVGMIVANSFMKRSFGQKLIEEIIPNFDLTHVVDTSGAYIPGHGTPTVIVFGRNQAPQSDSLRAVLGIRGEPSTPDIPAEGKVWRSVLKAIQSPDFENDYVSSSQTERELFHTHPWSVQGGGAQEVKAAVENGASSTLEDETDAVGFGAISGEDNVFLFTPLAQAYQEGLPLITCSAGEDVRDWTIQEGSNIGIWPYDKELNCLPEPLAPSLLKRLWPYKTPLNHRKRFGTPIYKLDGIKWYEWREFYKERFKTPLTITFAEVATHNHFVLDRGGKVFKQTAPIIKLPAIATEDDHLGLLGLLNSSTACFWLKQVAFGKHIGDGRNASAAWQQRFQYDSTKVGQVPVCQNKPTRLATQLDQFGQRYAEHDPATWLERNAVGTLDEAKAAQEAVFHRMVGLQEELDWRCYGLYGLLEEPPVVEEARWEELPEVKLGQRAFEIVLARKVAAGDIRTAWFERHGSEPVTEIPAEWPAWYREVVQARIDAMGRVKAVRLIETPKYKRRWNIDPWDKRERAALEGWLLARLESGRYIPAADRGDEAAQEQPRVVSVRELAQRAEDDPELLAAGARYTGEPTFSVERLVERLVLSHAAPHLPTQRYKASGLRRRREWERVWAQQRRDDAITARAALPDDHPRHLTPDAADALRARLVGTITKPPKYRRGDFRSGDVYSLRGKLDVPREAFALLDGCPREDGTPVLVWMGLDHAQRAKALAAHYNDGQYAWSWSDDQRLDLLAGLLDLLPHVRHWHPDDDPLSGVPLADTLSAFIEAEATDLGVGLKEIEVRRLGDASLLGESLGRGVEEAERAEA